MAMQQHFHPAVDEAYRRYAPAGNRSMLAPFHRRIPTGFRAPSLVMVAPPVRPKTADRWNGHPNRRERHFFTDDVYGQRLWHEFYVHAGAEMEIRLSARIAPYGHCRRTHRPLFQTKRLVGGDGNDRKIRVLPEKWAFARPFGRAGAYDGPVNP